MCGIILEILYRGKSILKDQKLVKRIHNRGPDCSRRAEIDLDDGTKVIFCGAVLWMQGPLVTHQPLESESGILLYNGDIFDETRNNSFSDTQLIMDKLSSCKNTYQVIQELKTLRGPFSLMYYKKSTKSIIFTRDKIGRNSLLFHRNENSIVISNVLGRSYKCIEIPATHIQVLNICTKEISLHPWVDADEPIERLSVDQWLKDLETQQSLPDEEFSFELTDNKNLIDKDNIIKYIESQAKEIKCNLNLMNKLLENEIIKKIVTEITVLLEKSIKIRLDAQPQKCQQCLYKERTCNHCTVGILFSGGLDCTILAYLANKYLSEDQTIELLNVAFKKELNGSYDVPDRKTGKQSFEELTRLCPRRKWIFKEINVPNEELQYYQKCVIADLVYPRQTVLDESLGSALWFAARGHDAPTSTCRVLLLGSGADELFGGYTRHRNAFRRQGWPGLEKELLLDWSRISFRNLARDNRVICDHGRQPRMPYLDEDFTDYVLKLDPWLKCFPSEPLAQGVGDKLMLRLVALNLGLTDVVTFPKRALQFGSRIANKKEKGSDVSKTFMDMQINEKNL